MPNSVKLWNKLLPDWVPPSIANTLPDTVTVEFVGSVASGTTCDRPGQTATPKKAIVTPIEISGDPLRFIYLLHPVSLAVIIPCIVEVRLASCCGIRLRLPRERRDRFCVLAIWKRDRPSPSRNPRLLLASIDRSQWRTPRVQSPV